MIAAIATTVLAATIALKPEASVRGATVTLSEIADLSALAPDEAARLGAIEVGAAPAPGWTRRFDGALVAKLVAASGSTASVSGADACKAAPATRVVEAKEIGRIAEAALRARFAGLDCEIKPSGEPRPLVVPEPDDAASFQLKAVLDERASAGGAWTVGVQVWIDGQPWRTAFATYEVAQYAKQAVLVHPVRRGEAVPAGALELRRVKLASAGAARALTAEQAAGALAMRDLAPGAVVAAGDVQRERLVRRGEPIVVEVKKGAIVARSTMLAQEDGSLGDRVKVLSGDKRTQLVAHVVGRSAVRVDL
jgi:flagella basal body P-ring formation protein FlgA